jgi:DNA primase
MRRDQKKFQKRINKAIARSNVRDILDVLDIPYRQQGYGDLWFRCALRNHRNDKKASAHITHMPGNPNHGIWHCFGCEESGTVIDLFMQRRNVRFKEALMMTEHHYIEIDDIDVNPFYKKIMAGLPKFYQSPAFPEAWNQEYLSYLSERGITWNQIVEHQIGYVDAGRLHRRVIVPIMLFHRLETWVGRHIDKDAPEEKRITSALGGRVGLFGSEMSNPYKDPAIISEGWGDAAAIERVGFANSMAAQTNRIHPEQYEYISMFPYAIFVPDGDDGGKRFVDSLAPYIQDFTILVAKMPEGYDPNKLEREDPNELIRRIKDASEWKPSKEKYEVDIDYQL